MKMKSQFWLSVLILAITTAMISTSCKKTFDAPPTFVEPNITANMTIKELKALHTVVGAFDKITVDKVISGIVVGDDKSGNLYKSIIIQDTTGGITVRLESSNLYTSYPVGRKIYIRVKDLYLGDYGGLIQLGGSIDNSDPTRPELATIPAALFDTYIVKGSTGNVVTPKVVTPSMLGTGLQDVYLNTLVQMDNFEFASSDTAKTYADPTRSSSAVNFTIANCSGQSIVLRNSSYANFTGINVPNGNGTIYGIYTVFNGTKQFTIRDTSDVKFYGTRCPAAVTNIVLGTSPVILDFNSLDADLPTGVTVRRNASASSIGTTNTLTTSRQTSLWANFSSGFRNYASATGLTATSDSTAQVNSSNRALGVRQVSSTDVGVAFVFEIANTTGKSNLQMQFNLQSLDDSSPRTVTWAVDYGIGAAPTSFTAATATGNLTTGGNTFSNNVVNVNFGSALNNVNNTIFIRVVALTPSTGGGNRPSTAIDDVKFTFN